MRMRKRFTEEDLTSIIKKNGLKEHSSKINIGNTAKHLEDKVSLNNNKKQKTKKNSFINIYALNKINNSAIVSTTVSDKHIALVFDGAKLLSINQIFAFLQSSKLKFSFFTYKKNWHDLIKVILDNMQLEAISKGSTLPFFDTAVELTIFRQSPKLVDEDALTTMFKFIIDGLKRTEDNPNGVLAEDNPKIVHKITCYSEKGTHCVGINIRLIEGNKKESYNMEKLLNN